MYFFIVNPASHSGEGMRLWQQVESLLLERGIAYRVWFSQKAGDIARIARQITGSQEASKECSLVVLGGDGTVNEAVNGIVDFETVRFSYIPTGSSNDLARDMDICKDMEKALDAILSGKRERRMDIGCLEWEELGVRRRRRFAVSCGIGYDAAVCAGAQSSSMKNYLNRIGLGKFTYLGIGLKRMFSAKYVGTKLRLNGEKEITLKKLLFVAVMSHRYEGGGFCFCPYAKATDGLLDLCIVNGVPKWMFPFMIPFARKGRHGHFRGIKLCRAQRVEIETELPMWVHTDGEVMGMHDRITVTISKRRLRFVY